MRVTRGLKLRVWLNALELDQDLANGCRPSHSEQLELRTLQLASARYRWALAEELEMLVAHSACPPEPRATAVPLRWSEIAAAGDELLELAAALTHPGWNNVRGIALGSCLVRDPLGPLYMPGRVSLCDAADAARAALGAAV